MHDPRGGKHFPPKAARRPVARYVVGLLALAFAWGGSSVQGGEAKLTRAPAPRPKALPSPLPKRATLRSQITGTPDTVRILALRVEFQPDNLSTTTGDGTFDLSTSAATTIDPPPHDRNYFQAQLLALANYYYSVSGGKLVIRGDVFPRDDKSAYRLAHRMDYYNPPEASSNSALRDQRLAQLFRDAVQLADADSEVSFSSYDCVIVFHAGVGQDFAFDFDPTPNDIPSAFLDPAALAKGLGEAEGSWPGIPVDGGRHFVREGMILPETQSQEGYEIGLLGTACILFGSWLGLPALWNTDDGSPGIGRWGLMDQGSGNGSGLLPAQPCAWSRVYLGWCQPIVIDQAESLAVAAWKARDPRKIYKIPINEHEYFLIENRQRDVNRDGIALGRDNHGNRVEFKFDRDGRLQLLHEGTLGVITQVDEYDFGLPGSGILIWHIDEEVLRRNLASNRVNADPQHRAVDLEEADGAQDIGQHYGLLSPGSGAEEGVPEDAFWAGNEINRLVNGLPEVAFTPYTEPNTHSYSGAASHIFVTGFSDLDSIMYFSVRREKGKRGFPVYAGAELVGHTLLADVDGDGAEEILAATKDARLVCWRGDGTPFAGSAKRIPLVGASRDTVWHSDATFFLANPTEPIRNPVLSHDGVTPLVIWAAGRSIWALRAPWGGGMARAIARFDSASWNAGLPLRSWPRPEGTIYSLYPGMNSVRFLWIDRNGSPGVAEGSEIPGGLFDFAAGAQGCFAVDLGGRLHAFDAQLRPRWSAPIPEGPAHLAVGDLDGDGSPEIVALSQNGAVSVFDETGTLLPGFPTRPVGPCSGFPALGDMDGRGGYEIAFVTDQGSAVVLDRGGLVVPGWPVLLRRPGAPLPDDPPSLPTTPILLDLDGDGGAELIAPDGLGGLHALRRDGRTLPGFPLAVSAQVVGVAAGDIDADGLLELVVAGREGLVYAWETDASPAGAHWPQPLANGYASGSAERTPAPPEPPSGQGTVLVAGSAHCYPNPTAGQMAHIRFTLKCDASIRAEIYDLAGSKVTELRARGRGGLDNELVWDSRDAVPGVYLVRLAARSETAEETAIIKLAVTP